MSFRPILELRFFAVPENLKMARDEIAGAIGRVGCSEEVGRSVVVAVNEACMNIIQHGYRGDPAGEIVLEILNDGEQLLVELRDSARTADPQKVCPRKLEDLRPGGLGTHFIQEIMDDFTMCAGPGGKGNVWRMTKTIERD